MKPRVVRRGLEMFSNLAPRVSAPRVSTALGLSPRERQFRAGMADGLTNKAIAARLGLSAHTTDDSARAIHAKLNVNTRGGAAVKAMRDRLI